MSRMHTQQTSLFGYYPLRAGPVALGPRRPTKALGPSLIILTIGSSPAVIMLASASFRACLVARPPSFSAGGASAGGTC
jgi:hypothetical protein